VKLHLAPQTTLATISNTALLVSRTGQILYQTTGVRGPGHPVSTASATSNAVKHHTPVVDRDGLEPGQDLACGNG
jgi:hypothetical protein